MKKLVKKAVSAVMLLSLLLAQIPTSAQTESGEVSQDTNTLSAQEASQSETLETHNDGIDWWALAKTKGVYVTAAAPNADNGMSAYLDNRLYDLTDSTDLNEFGDKIVNGKNATEILSAGYKLVCEGSDSAMKVASATSGDNITKATFFSGKNMRGNGAESKGNMYFAVTSDKITSDDDEVYVIIEYLDYDPNMSTTQNSNNTSNYKNQSYISPTFATNPAGGKVDCTGYPNFNRHNTNTWKTVAIPVSNAELTSTNTKTGLADNKNDIKICVNRVNTHISRIGVVKASDVGYGEKRYYAPKSSGDAPTIWLAGDSLVENLDTASAYPREGWGMELANYFIRETTSAIAVTDETTTQGTRKVAEKKNNGVKVINKAKGGKSTRTFLNEVDPTRYEGCQDIRWADILQNAKYGDYLFVSFCINDVGNRTSVQTNPYLVGDTGDRFSHRANIAEFKSECDKIGVNLVLLTPAANRNLPSDQDAHIVSLHAQGRELGVPVIDVRTYHEALVESLKQANDSEAYSTDKTKLIYNHILDKDINAEYNTGLGSSDDTHINQTGAKEICKIIINEIKRKSASFESMKKLAEWIDPAADITTMAAPAHQTTDLKYEVSDAVYIVNGTEKPDYQQGKVQVKLTVTNIGSDKNDAIVYAALYDGNDNPVKIATSDKKEIAVGESVTLTTSVIDVPDLDGYHLRKFVWNSDMDPYDQSGCKIVVAADGSNRRASLRWTLSEDLGNVTFDIYRDNLKIGTTKNGGYADETVQRGEHLYQVNVVDESGTVVAQSAYASVTVTNFYEVKQNAKVSYVKANIDSAGNGADFENKLTVQWGGTVYDAAEAQTALSLSDEDVASHKDDKGNLYKGYAFVTNDADSAYKRVRVSDTYGNEKEAWRVSCMYRPAKSSAVKGYLTFLQKDTTYFTADDTTITIFIEFLANGNAPTIEYSKVGNTKGTVSATAFGGSDGDWRIARYDIKDACFADGNGIMSGKNYVPFRIVGNFVSGTYVSSVVVVKGDAAYASKIMAELNNLGFNEADVKSASSKYPNGVSADFSTGKAVLNGMDIYYSTEGTADNAAEISVADDGVGYWGTRYIERNSTPWQSYLYFKIDPEYLYGGTDNTLYITLTYKADHNVNLNMMFPSYDKDTGTSSDGNVRRTVAKLEKDDDTPWKTITFEADSANILNLDNNGASFRMCVPVNGNDPTQQLKIRDIKIGNASVAPVKISTNADATATQGHTVYIAADSIAANYSADKVAETGITGWGMVIGDYLTDDITISNNATPGTSTRTFSNMPSILSKVKQGDYVLISFGHNDQTEGEKFVSVDDYKANLTNWIKQIREKKGVPVLVTMIPQGSTTTGTLLKNDSFSERRNAVAQVAESEGVMLVKLGEQMMSNEEAGVYTELYGDDYISDMYCNEGYTNRTHVVETGAREIAKIIVNAMKEQSPYFAKFVK